MSDRSLQEFIEEIKKTSELFATSLDHDGDWAPMLFVETKAGAAALLIDPTILNDKDRFAQVVIPNLVRTVEKQMKATVLAVVFLASAWMVKIEPIEDLSDVRPSEHPDRIEALILCGVSKEDEFSATAEIHRDGKNHPTLDWMHDWPQGMEGRFISGIRRAVWE